MAARCAADNSAAEKDFFFSPSRAAAKVSEVSSLTAQAHPTIAASAVRQTSRTQNRHRRPQFFSSTRYARPPARRPCSSTPARRRCTLLDDLWHQKIIIFTQRRVLDDVFGNSAIGHDIRSFLHRHRRYRRHRLDAIDVDLAELLDERQNGV